MNRNRVQVGASADDASAIQSFVDAQPGLSPHERSFMKFALLRDPAAVTELGIRTCEHNCEAAR